MCVFYTNPYRLPRCRNFAVRDRNVCHIHGGKTPKHNLGPKTEEGKFRQKMASWKHGMRSQEVKEEAYMAKRISMYYKEKLNELAI
jgi:hypothetical protein